SGQARRTEPTAGAGRRRHAEWWRSSGRTREEPPIWTVVGLWMESRWTRQMDRSGSTVGSLNAGCQPGRGGPLVADVRRLGRSTVTGGVGGDVRQEAAPAGQARCGTLADRSLFRAAGGGGHDQPGAKRSLSPTLRSTEKNHSVDAPVPATTSAMVAAVETRRNTPAGSVNISTVRPAGSNSKKPAHSQVALWQKRCSPGGWGAGCRSATTSAG